MSKETPEQEAEKMYPDADVQKIKKEFPEERDHVRIINTINYEAGIRRSAHITAARMYMGEVDKYRKALEDIREIKSIDYACYQKTQAIISETLK